MDKYTSKINSTWDPWPKKIHFYCPICNKKMSATNPSLPDSAPCTKCRQELYIERATYPIWKVSGFLLVAILFSALNIPRCILIIILSGITTCLIYRKSRKRFKISTIQYIAGSLTSLGCETAIILCLLFGTMDRMTKEAQEKQMQNINNTKNKNVTQPVN